VIFEGFLRRSFNTTEPPPSAPHCPTASEREIIQLLAEGKSNKEVAQALGISVKTAEPHCAAIVRKLGLSSFSEIVR
jgi:DNA-binding NarL/FixJ family response regulator